MRDSNPRLLPRQESTLPAELIALKNKKSIIQEAAACQVILVLVWFYFFRVNSQSKFHSGKGVEFSMERKL